MFGFWNRGDAVKQRSSGPRTLHGPDLFRVYITIIMDTPSYGFAIGRASDHLLTRDALMPLL